MFIRVFFVLTNLLAVVLPARAAWAHDAPTIAPTRLDFDASQTPKNCNDQAKFKSILANWVHPKVLSSEADRRLIVRIRGSRTGGELVDVTLVDAAGSTIAAHHNQHGFKIECYEVLYETAFAAAKLLGAFEKPPPPEPCPSCPSCPACPRPRLADPTLSAPCPALPPPRIVVPVSPMRLTSVGTGVLMGRGSTAVQVVAPEVSLAFVLSPRVPGMRIEIDGARAPATLPESNALRGEMVPLFLSLCHAPSALRLCTGLVTTFFLGEPENDAIHTTLAASLRIGTEFNIAGPFSIRIDGFALVPFWGRTFGEELAAAEAFNSLTAAASVMGVWSFE